MLSSSICLTSRYISNNPFERRASQDDYNHHIRRLSDIRNSVSISKQKNPEYHTTIYNQIQKQKQKSKNLLLSIDEKEVKRQNDLIALKLNRAHKNKYKLNSPDKQQKVKASSKLIMEQKARNQKILAQNLVLIKHLKNHSKSPRQMKSQIKQKVKQYLWKRAHLRRNILPEEQKVHKKQLQFPLASQESRKSLYHLTRVSLRSLSAFKQVQSEAQ